MKASAWGSASAAVAGILTISQGPWTALISIFSPGLITLFSSQPVALAQNFPSRPSSSVIVLVSVLRRIWPLVAHQTPGLLVP